MGAAVPSEGLARMTQFAQLVQQWNRRIDLTAARNEDELVDLLFADALLLMAHIPTSVRVVDVGTGAGRQDQPG